MSTVRIYKYDLTQGMAKQLSPMFLGFQIEGIWHTSIVLFGKEFYFDGGVGIEIGEPGNTRFGRPVHVEEIGTSNKTENDFRSWCQQVGSSRFGPNDYHLLQNNCNNFTSEACRFLFDGQKDIPADVKEMIPKLLATPMGQMVRPMLEQMTTQNVGRSERDQFQNLQQQFQQNNNNTNNNQAGQQQQQQPTGGAAASSQQQQNPSRKTINEQEWEKLLAEIESKPAVQSLNSVMFVETSLTQQQQNNSNNNLVYPQHSGSNNVELDERLLSCLGFAKNANNENAGSWSFCGDTETLETAKMMASSLLGDLEARWSNETQ